VPAPFHVRPAKPADIPALFRLKQRLAEGEGNEAVLRATESDWRRDAFASPPRFRALLAEAGEQIFGMVTFCGIYSTALAGPIFSIQDLFVEAAYRKLGAGRALLARVAETAIAEGVPLLQLDVHAGNPARSFYRTVGFQHLRDCLTYAIGGAAMLALAATQPFREETLTRSR
jgi:GNAT superfamily N-acetyltransferase